MKQTYNFTVFLSISYIFFLVVISTILLTKEVLSESNNKQPCKIIEIRQGDTLAKICRKYYGKYSKRLCSVILKNNPDIRMANQIYAGGKLCLPNVGNTILYSTVIDNSNNVEPVTIITIKKGDTLITICRSHYGIYTEHLLKLILKKNPVIDNPNHIIVGSSLYLPNLILPTKRSELIINALNDDPHDDKSEPVNFSEHKVALYPPTMPGYIVKLKWTSDNEAIIHGHININAIGRFFVYVPGDLEYEQLDLTINPDNTFKVTAVIGRQGQDYNKEFVLKLALFDTDGTRIGEIRRSILRKRHKTYDEISLIQKNSSAVYKPHPTGWKGLKAWLGIQELSAMQSDNNDFRVPRGLIVFNYRYLGYNPDERYLSWYGRVTLYGSSCLAKALLLSGEIEKAESILRVWVAQINETGKIPRSANTIGDNYISPDVRTGDTSHFLGALALAKAITKSNEWDVPIHKIMANYIYPLIDSETGLVQGGYNGKNSNGYKKPNGYNKVPWFSSEHNFDLFQALILLTRIDEIDPSVRKKYSEIAKALGKSIDNYLWDQNTGTFNRGWRKDTGPDMARALDCSSWGALYLLKQAKLANEQNKQQVEQLYIAKARQCLDYVEKHFKTKWYYKTPDGKDGVIEGYRPYDGKIDDVRWESGVFKEKIINWDLLNDMVWSEGTLGVAKAWEEYERQVGIINNDNNNKEQNRSNKIYKNMKILQSLSDQGGLLYSTIQIKGHFTMGEELASLSWLGYFYLSNNKFVRENHNNLIQWVAW